jgi:hypothetical protein
MPDLSRRRHRPRPRLHLHRTPHLHPEDLRDMRRKRPAMTLFIGRDLITSDITEDKAEFRRYAAADGGGAWVCTARPGQLLTRDQAIAAVTICEEQARDTPDPERHLRAVR